MKKILFFSLIIFLGFFLHFYRLDKNPPGLNLDEVVMGYDAYSVLKTGKDQYKTFLPSYFRSHDDYKPPFIIYSQIPSIVLLGLTDFAVRLPSAIFGMLAIVFVYFLTKELFKSKKVGLVASLLLAISPWHLQFTRTAYEVGIQPFLTSAGLYFFIKKKWILAAIFLGVGMYLYTASRVFIPLLVICTSIIYFNKKLIYFWAIFLLFLLPTIYLFTTVAGQMRFKGTSVFQDVRMHDQNISYQISDWLRRDRFSPIIFHPDSLAYYQEIIKGYFVHLSPNFLFLGITHPSTNYVPDTGLMYLWELPFLLSGFYFLFRKQDKKPGLLLVFWVLLAPLPASVTVGLPTSIRTTIILPSLQIIVAYGIINILKNWKYLYLILPIFVTYFFAYYLHMYYVHAPLERSKFWYTPYREIVMDSYGLSKKYSNVIVSTSLDQPQSFYLYYLKYDPKRYQEVDGGTISGNFAETRNHMENIYFKPFDWTIMNDYKNTLFVGRPNEFSPNINIIKKYYYLNGEVAVEIGEK